MPYRRPCWRRCRRFRRRWRTAAPAALAFPTDKSAAETLAVLPRGDTRSSRLPLPRPYDSGRGLHHENRRSNCPEQPGPERSRFQRQVSDGRATSAAQGRVAGNYSFWSILADLYLQLRSWRSSARSSGGLLLAAIVASRLQRLISGRFWPRRGWRAAFPLIRDYSIRAGGESKDETGVLVGSFNEMMQQIYERDYSASNAHGGMEDRVRERTANCGTKSPRAVSLSGICGTPGSR